MNGFRIRNINRIIITAAFLLGLIAFISTRPSAQNRALAAVPEYSGAASVTLNNNQPEFTDDEITTASYEQYGALDSYGRCTTAIACIGTDLMPSEERSSIGMIKPTGWNQNKYPGIVDSEPPYLYNRCHLIGYQLTGENANECNLVTGTRYMNVDGMLPYENEVASYIKNTGNHVMYRVTPIFEGSNLLCSGVQMEAYSVEDSGKGVSFNVYCYNVQPGVIIDYTDGSNSGDPSYTGSTSTEATIQQSGTDITDNNSATSGTDTANGTSAQSNSNTALAGAAAATIAAGTQNSATTGSTTVGTTTSSEAFTVTEEISESAESPACNYVANKNTKKFHYPSCSSVGDMKESNKLYYEGTRDELISQGYVPCKRCNP
jgi:DNA-entry nuclease